MKKLLKIGCAIVILITLVIFISKIYCVFQTDNSDYSAFILLYLLIQAIICEVDLYVSIKCITRLSKVIYRVFNGIAIPIDIAVIVACLGELMSDKMLYFLIPVISYFVLRITYMTVSAFDSDE